MFVNSRARLSPTRRHLCSPLRSVILSTPISARCYQCSTCIVLQPRCRGLIVINCAVLSAESSSVSSVCRALGFNRYDTSLISVYSPVFDVRRLRKAFSSTGYSVYFAHLSTCLLPTPPPSLL
jgi:hypothetical protein